MSIIMLWSNRTKLTTQSKNNTFAIKQKLTFESLYHVFPLVLKFEKKYFNNIVFLIRTELFYDTNKKKNVIFEVKRLNTNYWLTFNCSILSLYMYETISQLLLVSIFKKEHWKCIKL